ncbi:hypothetical protein KIW84_012642 [Lathyrus oleraceus]|uniref:Uncharacterized protein n=1 Tax=Pisum sativum TaxID=3888 RepID=A0A9D5BID3_PEA|nr:hypothetical protein KIW84_012642 [Pisum sativum]
MPYKQILPYLIERGLIVPKKLNPVIPPYPPGFDVNARCDFHARSHGLQINNTPSPSCDDPSVHVMEEISENRSEDGYHMGLDEHNYHYSEEG